MSKPTHYEYEQAKATVAAQLSGNLPEDNMAADVLANEFEQAMQIIHEYEVWFANHYKVMIKKDG